MFRNLTTYVFACLIGVAAVLAGCDAFSNNRDINGRVQILLTDNPLQDFAAANVTIRRVELLGTDRSGESVLIVLSDQPRSFDLLTLQNGVTAHLAEADVPPGRYNQVRLVVDETAEVLLTGGEARSLKVPSGTQTGIKVLFPHFDVSTDDDVATLTVDFDLEASFVKAGASGMYIFKPVLKPEAMVVNGDEVAVQQDGV